MQMTTNLKRIAQKKDQLELNFQSDLKENLKYPDYFTCNSSQKIEHVINFQDIEEEKIGIPEQNMIGTPGEHSENIDPD